MAYLSETTYEILEEKKGKCFPVDDLLVQVIQILNRKGYTTHFSCEGHEYRAEEVSRFPDELSAERYGLGNMESMIELPNGQIEVRYNLSPIKNTNLYIEVDGEVDFPDLPEGFVFSCCRLRYYYPHCVAVKEFNREKTRIGKILLDWAKALPENPLRVLP